MYYERGVLSLVICGLILISGCQDHQGVKPWSESEANSVQSEQLKQELRQEFERCLKAAESGDAMEQSNLGVLYLNGEGVEQDSKLAVMWLRKSAEQGNAVAQFNLGLMYHNGEGVKQDSSQGNVWLNKSYKQLKKQNKL